MKTIINIPFIPSYCCCFLFLFCSNQYIKLNSIKRNKNNNNNNSGLCYIIIIVIEFILQQKKIVSPFKMINQTTKQQYKLNNINQ
jgi:hypothetical protein